MPMSEFFKNSEKASSLNFHRDLHKKILWANKDAFFGTPMGALFGDKSFPWPLPLPPGSNKNNAFPNYKLIPIRNEADPDYAGSLIRHADKNILGM